jgi:hypothetical protein
VTLSDDKRDPLEDKVCLFRQPEMVVETLDKRYEGHRYHAFLVAGAAISPTGPSDDDVRADDFLRFAEPPPHNQWIPRSGRHQASQVNLNAHYSPPWVPNLKAIERAVFDALDELFDVVPNPEGKGPESVLRHLRFLRSDPGDGPSRGGSPRKPELEIVEWAVTEGRWDVVVEVVAPNRPSGWSIEPMLVVDGLDGQRQPIPWGAGPTPVANCAVNEGRIEISPAGRGRRVSARFKASSTTALPIPADLAVIDVATRAVEPLAVTT